VYSVRFLSRQPAQLDISGLEDCRSIPWGAAASSDCEAKLHPKTISFFIIDESMRGDHLSLNGYSRADDAFFRTASANRVFCLIGKDSAFLGYSQLAFQYPVTNRDQPTADVSRTRARCPPFSPMPRRWGIVVSLLDVQMNTHWLMQSDDYSFVDEWLTEQDFHML